MLIAFTGAGISAASGIPTFQDIPGIRDKLSRSFAKSHPTEFAETIKQLRETCLAAEPNDAHTALAEYGVPVITMNVDGLHRRAGTEHILEIHGNVTDPENKNPVVLYGDPAPLYSEAETWVYALGKGDVLLVAGTSYYTNISKKLADMASQGGAMVVEINSQAEVLVRKTLEAMKDFIEDFDTFQKRLDGAYVPMPGPYSGGWDRI